MDAVHSLTRRYTACDSDRVAFAPHFKCALRIVRGLGAKGKDFVKASSKTTPSTIAYADLGSDNPVVSVSRSCFPHYATVLARTSENKVGTFPAMLRSASVR